MNTQTLVDYILGHADDRGLATPKVNLAEMDVDVVDHEIDFGDLGSIDFPDECTGLVQYFSHTTYDPSRKAWTQRYSGTSLRKAVDSVANFQEAS